ncbi:hypothetical protein [Aquimarina agarilytica]|uniref:hypothetical protein n=1 Tax=Aquimarina agarilytica TaxID=1087449 RepID=UPI0002DD87DD|nr:hypothetical protein [Aquimarina agarilytica]
MKPIYTTIPIMLCKYALVNRRVNHLALYIYLKHNSSGYIQYSGEAYKKWAEDLKMSERWTRDAIKWLIEKGWITVNNKRKSYRITSYKNLHKKLNLVTKSAVIYELNNFISLREFCCAALITYYMKVKRFSEKKRRSVSKIGDANTNHYFYPKGFYAIPISYIAKCLGVSNSTANKYKKCAEKSGLLEVRNTSKYFIDNIKADITYKDISFIKKTFPYLAGRLRLNKNKHVVVVETDIIRSVIIGKKKRL